MASLYDPGRSFLLLVVAWLLAAGPLLGDTNERRGTKLADGVYAIEHKYLYDGSSSGNTTVIIEEREVLVVDSCYRPSSAQEDIAEIRQWTNKPVGYLLNTHFHNDHNNGNKPISMHSLPWLSSPRRRPRKTWTSSNRGTSSALPRKLKNSTMTSSRGRVRMATRCPKTKRSYTRRLSPI